MPLWGVHNAVNALAVWAAGRRDGLGADELAAALARFRGVKRRQELLAEHRGLVVIDDFAHHPTAVEKTLASMRMRYPERRLLACFEPRSLTAGRAFLLEGYARAFAVADLAFFAPIFHRDRLAPEDRLDLEALTAELSRGGTPCALADDFDALLARVLAEARSGDVILTMSSGSFGGLPRRLADAVLAGG
jgi:UDP-N-acetylmuramate: L-alanyl-gamma-D-glutamyl-meso-diaminopimelate ligase